MHNTKGWSLIFVLWPLHSSFSTIHFNKPPVVCTAQTADTACLWHWTDAGRFPKFRHLPQPQGKIEEELKSCCKLPSTLFKYPTTRQYKIFNLLYIVSTLVVKFQRTCSFLTLLIFLNFQIAEPPDVSRRRSFTKRRRVQSRRRQRARRWRNSPLNNGQWLWLGCLRFWLYKVDVQMLRRGLQACRGWCMEQESGQGLHKSSTGLIRNIYADIKLKPWTPVGSYCRDPHMGGSLQTETCQWRNHSHFL